jgi:hypothetical protein
LLSARVNRTRRTRPRSSRRGVVTFAAALRSPATRAPWRACAQSTRTS